MKRLILSTIFLISLHIIAGAQSQITENSVVKDSTGQIYPYSLWSKLLSSGYYYLKAIKPSQPDSGFLLIRLTEEQRQKRIESAPKPPESKFFKTGKEVSSFKTTDINGNKIILKELKGKIVVVNFWFINCEPCRKEMPELNQMVSDYKDSSDIVFLAVALDDKADLKDFLKKTSFAYTIIDNGRFITQQYGISSYPTHLILDREGKAYYHSSGYGMSTVRWLRKSIEEILKGKG